MTGTALVPRSEPPDLSTGAGDAMTAGLDRLLTALAEAPVAGDDATRIDRIAAMERLKCALSAAQMREGPCRGSGLVGLAELMTADMPAVLALMTAGELSEWRAAIIARETCCLGQDERRKAGAELASTCRHLSDRQLAAEARRIAYRLDPHAFVAKAAKAAEDRRVSIRPAPDTMTWISALLPVKLGVALFASLTRAADRAQATGDERSHGQLMADTLVEKVTGLSDPDRVPIEVTLVMTDSTLLRQDQEPVELQGYGPVPAPMARGWLRDLPESTTSWLRRLYTDPATGVLRSLDSKARGFTGTLRRAVITRDQVCRTPRATSPPGGADRTILTTTPTGHTYSSAPPPLPGERSNSAPGRTLSRYEVITVRWPELVA